jgi:hypothetical protein
MRIGIVAVVVMLTIPCGAAFAQRTTSKVIDTDALVIKPVETTTTVVGRSFQYVSRVVANTIDNNALIRTVNNLFGTKPRNAPVQPGLSPLPDPRLYPSGYYKSPIQPVMPQYQTVATRR